MIYWGHLRQRSPWGRNAQIIDTFIKNDFSQLQQTFLSTSSRIVCMSNWQGHDGSPGKPTSQVVLFSFSSENAHKLTSRPPLSFSPTTHLQPCPVIVSDLLVQQYIAGDLLNVTLDAERPKSHQRPPTEKPRLYCSGLLLHQQRNSTL